MNLIVFFNGWGMGEEVIKNIKIPNEYKFINVSYPYDFNKKILEEYNEINFIGWSFGVYYLSKFLNLSRGIEYNKIISINGTPEIIGNNGIPENIFYSTLKNMNEENFKKFQKNSGLKIEIKKDINLLIEELKKLKEDYLPQENFISIAIIGKKDRIVPWKNQKKYYKKTNAKVVEIPIEHNPFNYFNSWEEILKIGETNGL